MDKVERLRTHDVHAGWMPSPELHLHSPRDRWHHDWTLAQLTGMPGASILDVGCWDGWLDFLLIRAGFSVHGVELIPELCSSALAYARAQRLEYRIHQGFFDEVGLSQHYDVVLAYEVLEHISLDLVPLYVAKMESVARKRILISLPDQRHEDNRQHLWTPTMAMIDNMWSGKKGFHMEYRDYPGTDIPGNFMVGWEVI